ncbi:MAG: 50S ribosomal protein L24e [Thermoplasmata archaeon]|nr:50S ribosomal protein L24e [Thermoplasmata archaeon]
MPEEEEEEVDKKHQIITHECSFCGKQIEPGTGMLYVRRDGSVFHFCAHKCRVNMTQLKRVPRRVRWSGKYVKTDR